MWLAFCFPSDVAAHWAITGLRRRGLSPLEAVTPDALIYSRSLVHEITGGRPRTTFTLPDGRTVDSAKVRGVVNRVTALPMAHLGRADRTDAVYAGQELHALVLSVLRGFGDHVVNQPNPQGLAGCARPNAEWIALAGRAGLQTGAYREGNLDVAVDVVPRGIVHQVIVLDRHVHGSTLPVDVADACIELARLADTRLLGIELVAAAGASWWFRAASPVPDLRHGGETLLDALAVTLGGKAS